MKLKVCGLTQMDQIHELIPLNVDFLGFIFYEKSSRYVMDHLRSEDLLRIQHPGKVGVFVNEQIQNIVETVERCGLNFVQLHGDESEEFAKELKQNLSEDKKIIKVFRIGESFSFESTAFSSSADYFLFDTDSEAFGGTGKSFDWSILNQIEISKPYFLSGGISQENIQNLGILTQQPFVLDINSKFEYASGIKDLQKIKTFKSLLK